MSEPRSVRFEAGTIAKLARFASRHPGMTSSSAAAQLVEEGLRMDTHRGVVFRDGPAGRRACLVAGPDVWEVARAVRDARAAEPELEGDEIVALVAEHANLPVTSVRLAVSYYAAYPDEIDRQIQAADLAQDEAERDLQFTRTLLGT